MLQGRIVLLLRRAERYKQSARTSGGAEKWLDVRLFRSPTDAITSAKRAGYQARTPAKEVANSCAARRALQTLRGPLQLCRAQRYPHA